MKQISRFSFPTAIVFGPGAVRALADYLEEAGIKKPLLVTDAGLRKTPVFASVKDILDKSGVAYAVFSEVHPNPFEEDVEKAADLYRSAGCDGVIGLGGGSPLDAAKLVPLRVTHEGPLGHFDVQAGGKANIKPPLPPMLAIPTTAGTGSEVGSCSVITSQSRGRKYLICHAKMMPQLAVLDPELTVGLPPKLTAATGMDALTHNIESLSAPVFHPMCDAIAAKGIEFVASYLEQAVTEPTDLEARGYMMLAAMMGAVAFQKDLGTVHSLSHALSAVCHVGHGLANAICLVPVMKFNREAAVDAYSQVARCFGINTMGLTGLQAADKAIEAVGDLAERIGIPRSLREVGVDETALEELTEKAFADPCHATNPRACSKEDLRALFRQCLG